MSADEENTENQSAEENGPENNNLDSEASDSATKEGQAATADAQSGEGEGTEGSKRSDESLPRDGAESVAAEGREANADSAQAATKPPEKEPPTIKALRKASLDAELVLTEMEKLALAKVFHHLHDAYYDMWIRDVRDNQCLAMRLHRRMRRLQKRVS